MSNLQKPVTVAKLQKMKQGKEPIAMVTAYDYPSGQLAEASGVDVVLVGDSLGMVVLGYDSTVPVTTDDMVHHTRAVKRGISRPLLVADLPFLTYRLSIRDALQAAGRLMQEAGTAAVKMEGGRELAPTVKACVEAGIPVMGHIGLKPQAVNQTGYRIQGKTADSLRELTNDAEALTEAGVFAIVLECVTEEAAQVISETIPVPTIGIGSGRYCDGQVLVFHDLIQFGMSGLRPSFVKTYTNIGEMAKNALQHYVDDVKTGRFPEKAHVFHAGERLVHNIYGGKS